MVVFEVTNLGHQIWIATLDVRLDAIPDHTDGQYVRAAVGKRLCLSYFSNTTHVSFRWRLVLRSCWIEVRETEEVFRHGDVEKQLPVSRLEDVQRQRHTGKQHYRQGKEWELVQPTHFIAGFAHLIDRLRRGLWQRARRAAKT